MGCFGSRHYSVAFAGLFARGIIATALRMIFLVFATLFLLAGIARSSPITSTDAISAIPIQIINTNAGRVMTAHAEKYEDKVYVGGLVYRPSSPGIGAHVHVWGVDKNNHLVFSKTTSVMVTGKPSFIQSESYVVSVDPSTFDKAKVIYVTFHSQTDAQVQKGE